LLFGLSQRLLAGAHELDTALEGGQGGLQTEVALFHLLHQPLQFLERLFEVGRFGAFLGQEQGSGWRQAPTVPPSADTVNAPSRRVLHSTGEPRWPRKRTENTNKSI